MDDTLNLFAGEVEEYCRWCEGVPGSAGSEARTAIRHLSQLYLLAQDLQVVEDAPDVDGARPSDDDWRRVYERFACMPFGFYSLTLEPLDVGAESPEWGLGDVADDLADIYRDLLEGLSLFRAGHRSSAEWGWANSFRIHWGRHTVDAMRVLHIWCEEHGE